MTRQADALRGEPLGAPLRLDPRSAWQTVDTDALARHAVTSRQGGRPARVPVRGTGGGRSAQRSITQ